MGRSDVISCRFLAQRGTHLRLMHVSPPFWGSLLSVYFDSQIDSQNGVCGQVYIQTVDLITKEDIRVHSSGKLHNWKTCTKPMGAVAKKYKQKMD